MGNLNWLLGTHPKKPTHPSISDPIPLPSQSNLSPSTTKLLATLRAERLAAGLPLIPRRKRTPPAFSKSLTRGFDRLADASGEFMRWLAGEGPARRRSGRGNHGNHGERRRHHGSHRKGGSGRSGHSGKKRHHRGERRGERKGKDEREKDNDAQAASGSDSGSSPEIQAPQPVHVRKMKTPVPDISPLSRTIKDMQGMVPEAHHGKGKQRADGAEPLCRLCAKAPEYRPGNRLCETCMQLAFKPRNGAEDGGKVGRESEGLRVPFTSPTHSAEYYKESEGEFDFHDPRSREEFLNSSAGAYKTKQVKTGERDVLTNKKIITHGKHASKEIYEPIAWRQKGQQKGNGKFPEYITHSREDIRSPGFRDVLRNSPFENQRGMDAHWTERPFPIFAEDPPPRRTEDHVRDLPTRNPRRNEPLSHNPNSPSDALTMENLARLRLDSGPASPASVWTEVLCTETDPRARRSAAPPVPALPDYANPTVAAGSTAFHTIDRFRRDLNPTPSPPSGEESDGRSRTGHSRTGYTHIVDAYARDYSPPPQPVPRIGAERKDEASTAKGQHTSTSSAHTRRYSPPSPGIYPIPTVTSQTARPHRYTAYNPLPPSPPSTTVSGVGSRGRQHSASYESGDIADAGTAFLDDRDARRLFDPLNPAFFDPKANPWFKGEPSAKDSVPPAPVRKDTKFAQGREHNAGKEREREREREHEQREKESRRGDAAKLRDGMQSQGHYTDRNGNIVHLPPAKPPPKAPLPSPPAKPTPKPTARKTPMIPLPSTAPFGRNGPIPTAVRQQSNRITRMQDFSGAGASGVGEEPRASETLFAVVARDQKNEIERRNATRSPDGRRRGKVVEKEKEKEKAKEGEGKGKGKAWWVPGGWK
ncbi:hypothetical protein MMC30_002340 [Trapelia coarctata]|nr:hypothetical protein [Trapelia coarctata]